MSLSYIEPSPLICRANQWTGLYMIGASVMKELMIIAIIFLSSVFLITWALPVSVCS